MFKVVIFLCASTVFGSDCSFHNAIDVRNAGDAKSQSECMTRALKAEASYPTPIDPKAQYWKVYCPTEEQLVQAKNREEDPMKSPVFDQ